MVCQSTLAPQATDPDFAAIDAYVEAQMKDIGLPSTTTLKDGTPITRIATMLKQGAGLVTSRNHVRYVVTEYGVTDLYGKSIRQRAQQLISIAHPGFRCDLERQAKELHYKQIGVVVLGGKPFGDRAI